MCAHEDDVVSSGIHVTPDSFALAASNTEAFSCSIPKPFFSYLFPELGGACCYAILTTPPNPTPLLP